MPESYEEGLKYALRLISFKDYPKRLLIKKLLSKGFELSLAERIIDDLVEKDLLNEKKQIERAWEKLKVNCNYGRLAFLNNLKRMEYDSEALRLAELLYTEDEEITLARNVFNKIYLKLNKGNIDQAKHKHRIYSFMLRKGFSPDTIQSLIKEYEIEKGDI